MHLISRQSQDLGAQEEETVGDEGAGHGEGGDAPPTSFRKSKSLVI